MKQKLVGLKGEINNPAVGDINTPLSIMSRTTRQKMTMEIRLEKHYKPTISNIPIEYSTNKSLCSPQVHMESSPDQTICLAIKEDTMNFKGLKSY